MTKYISFCGTFETPENIDALLAQFKSQYEEVFEGTDSHGNHYYREIPTGFRDGLNYNIIGGKDSLTVYIAKIDDNTEHLVADCPEAGWVEETFVQLDEYGNPVKSPNNYNPNPFEQLI